MAMPILSVPPFPDVPNVAGVPALLRKATPVLNAIGYVTHVTNVVDRLFGSQAEEPWGIYDAAGTNQVLTPETFLGIDYKNGSRLVDYPLEQGAFETYNKVQNPFEASISMATGGTKDDREKLLNAVDALVKSLDLYTIITPEVTYQNVNMERYDYRRENRNGTHMIIVNLHFREIRVTALVNGAGTINPSAVKTPSAAPSKSLGQIASKAITSAETAALNGASKVLSSVKSGASSVIGGIVT